MVFVNTDTLIVQLLAAPTASLLGHVLYVPCSTTFSGIAKRKTGIFEIILSRAFR